MKETPSQKNLFTGSLDLDNEARSVKDNDYVDALNIRNSVSRDGKDKQVTKIRGNELVPFVQPQTPIPSSNKCIGAFENLATRLNYSFIYNSQGAMQIRENNIDSGTVTSVVEYNFGWQDDKFISNVDLVDNKLLLWTDTKPRRINISKSREDKRFKGNIYFTNTEIPQTTYTITVLDRNIVRAQADITFASPLNRRELTKDITDFINSDPSLSTVCTATTCQEHVEVEFNTEGYFVIDVTTNNAVGAIYVPQNYYYVINETIIDAGKYPLNCPPRLQIKQDDKRAGFNNIERTTWQFATQVIYDDFDESTLSPYSDIAFINCEQRGNYIEVDFTDTRLNDPVDLSIISKIRILARPSNQGKFREIAVIEQQDLWLNSGQIGSNTIRFYNDGQYTIIDDATATLPYSALPIEIVGDKYDMGEENFDNRVGYSKFIENYEAPCITAELTPTFQEKSEKRFTISGLLRIVSGAQFGAGTLNNNQPFGTGRIGAIYRTAAASGMPDFPMWGGVKNAGFNSNINLSGEGYKQYCPEGGFPVYLAGTNYLGISQQVPITGLPYTNNNALSAVTTNERTQIANWYSQYNQATQQGDMFSVWEIKNVPSGIYTIRVADSRCSIDDKLSLGDFFNLNKGTLYQKTSTNTFMFRDVITPNPINSYQDGSGISFFQDPGLLGYTEVTIRIRENGDYEIYSNDVGRIISGTADVNGAIYCCEIYVDDLCPMVNQPQELRTAITGYVYDGNSSSLQEDIASGASIELATVIVNAGSSVVNIGSITPQQRRTTWTDHNGHFYLKNIIIKTFNFQPSSVSGVQIVANTITGGSSTPQTIKNISDGFYNGTLADLFNNNLTQNGINGVVSLSENVLAEIIIYNTNLNVTQKCRTTVVGKVLDSNGNGVGGVLVNINRCGRQEFTQLDGTYSILVYGDSRQYLNSDWFTNNPNQPLPAYNSRFIDDINYLGSSSCGYRFVINGLLYYIERPVIDPFGAQGILFPQFYNNDIPYIEQNIICNLISISTIRHLKAGGRYTFALFHVDELNRRHALVTNNLSVSIPFLTEQRQDYFQNVGTGNSNGVFEFDLNVISPPPTWADKLYVARTQDTYYSDYLQFPLYDAKYVVQYDDENSLPIETTFSTFSANEIYLGFPQSTIAYKEFNSASQKGWDFQEGDRVRFISKPNGELYDKLYDLPIKAQRTDSTNEFIYFAVDNLDALGEVTQGTLVEVYRPKKDLDDNVELFFEIHQCIDIVDDINGQKQYVGLPKKLNTGDTYSRNRTVPISNGISSNFIEDNSISDNWQSRQQDIGRVVVKDTRFGRLVRENAIKFSNQYIPGSKLNGLSRFEPLNEFEYPRQYGAINKLIMVNDNADIQVLFVACENNSFVIYIKEVIYNDVRGAETVSVADRVLGSFRTLKGDYGTKNPESFAVRDGQLFWWDINRGAFVRYDNNGMDDISSLNTLQYALTIGNDTSVISTYDDFYSEFITIPLQENVQAIGFLSDKRGWNSKYSFKPEMLGTSGEWVLSWKNGELWVHDSPIADYCNFYGQQFTSKITFVSKLSPLGLKVAQNLRVKASDVWEALSITTVPNAMYKQGMMSRLKKGNWKNFEGDFWATILRNMNDPRFTDPNVALLRGEPLRGDAFIVELQNDSENLQSLRMAEMYYFSSENTNG
jgi:hypothetical protein